MPTNASTHTYIHRSDTINLSGKSGTVPIATFWGFQLACNRYSCFVKGMVDLQKSHVFNPEVVNIKLQKHGRFLRAFPSDVFNAEPSNL